MSNGNSKITEPLNPHLENEKSEKSEFTVKKRDQWSSKLEFILSCVGYAIGLGNVWRFPYLCYKNGGGAFLVPYFLALIFGGIPMFFMEVALGQSLNLGVIGVWKICPLFKGVGYAATIQAFWLNCYYIVILAWALFYLWHSFSYTLPWSHCNNSWNTPSCISSHDFINKNLSLNATSSSANEFWERKALQMTSRIEDQGSIRFELAISLLVVWIICYFCIWKGVKWTGKVVYFSALFPYIILLILLVRGLTLDGAWDGIKFLFIPKISKIFDSEAWIDAVTQIFFSYGLGVGAVVALGSYNKRKNNCLKDTIILAIFNEGTCLLASLVIFSVLGFMAKTTGKSIDEVGGSGPGLAFVAYPNAINQLPLSPFWSVLFFLMLIFIGLDSQFCTMEGFITACIDEWPKYLSNRREVFLAFICFISYLIGLTNITHGGIYIFNIFNTYACANWALLTIMFVECIAVSWCYGATKFYENVKDLIGFYPGIFWKISWLVLTPGLCLLVAMYSLVKYDRFTYKEYVYPWWGELIGWLMALSSILIIPIYAFYIILTRTGTLKEVLRPNVNINDFTRIEDLIEESSKNQAEAEI